MSEIKKVAIYDTRCVQNRPIFGVNLGAASVTNTPFNAIGANASQITFNINAPSEAVYLDKAVHWTSTCYLKVTLSPPAGGWVTGAGQPVAIFGNATAAGCALAAFPLHRCTNTMTATINDTTCVMGTSDLLDPVLRLCDGVENRDERTCPSTLDNSVDYRSMDGFANNILSGYADSKYGFMGNGAFPNVEWVTSTGVPTTAPVVPATPTDDVVAYVKFTSTERLVLSPFNFNDQEQGTGLYGIQNIQFVFNLQAPSRVFRWGGLEAGSGVTCEYQNVNGSPFINSKINCRFLTPPISLPLPAKNYVPYQNFSRYVSSSYPVVNAGNSALLQSQTIVLPSIPDLLVLFCRPQARGDGTQADWNLPLTDVNITFNNRAGILSSSTTEQLYQTSYGNGLKIPYEQWVGEAEMSGAKIPTQGGFLVLKPGQDFALSPGLAPGVNGSYSLQVNTTCYNQSANNVVPQLYIMAVDSGFFVSARGQSAVMKGILTEQDVISAPKAGTSMSVERLVGAGFFGKLGNALSKAAAYGWKHKDDIVEAVDVGRKLLGKGNVSGGKSKSLVNRLM